MSKMFDALRRAEEERRKQSGQTAQTEQQTAAEAQEKIERGDYNPQINGFPDSLLRELGILENSIDTSLNKKKRKTLIFTSATPCEGTTTISVSYARLLALKGEGRILICEMNARKPVFKELFAVNNGDGISDYFSGDSNLASIARATSADNLDVIHVGKVDPAFIQIHMQRVFPRLVEEAASVYDTVIFDTPAVVSSPETAPMCSYVDGVVIVVQAGKTKREIVQRSLNSIARYDGNVLGIILNRKKYYIPGFLYKRI
jgi:capsular exopolysaccharide synthesis family protein